MSVALFLLALSTCTSTLILLYLAYKMRQRFGKLDRNLGRQLERVDRLLKKTHAQHGALLSLQNELGVRARKQREEAARHQRLLEKALDAITRRQDKQKKSIEALDTAIADSGLDLGYQNSFNVLPLKYPLFFGRWSIDGVTAKCIVDTLRELRPKVVVELGSGSSTVLIAATLQVLGLSETRHIAVDHLEEYLNITRENLKLQGLSRTIEYWHCPLVPPTIDNDPFWYGGLPEKLGNTKIDLLFIDGPPGHAHPEARRPALDVLTSYLSEMAVVILDDTSRPQEARILTIWSEKNPHLNVEIIAHGKGCATIRRNVPTSAPTEEIVAL